MRRILFVAGALVVGIHSAAAQNLPVIKERQQVMKDTGAAAGAAAKMLKGETPFDLSAARTALNTFIVTAKKMPGLFPEDSKTGDDTKALPALGADKSDLDARFAKLGQDSTDALATIKDQSKLYRLFSPDFQKLRRLP
jgi:cytochrome c556